MTPRPTRETAASRMATLRAAVVAPLLLAMLSPAPCLAVPVIDFPGNGVINPTALIWHDDALPQGPFTVYLGTVSPPTTATWTQLIDHQVTTPSLADGRYYWRVSDATGNSPTMSFYAVTGLPPTDPVPETGSAWLMMLGLIGVSAALGRHRGTHSGTGGQRPDDHRA